MGDRRRDTGDRTTSVWVVLRLASHMQQRVGWLNSGMTIGDNWVVLSYAAWLTFVKRLERLFV